MKFNPKVGDKIICNNGDEAICCTLDFLRKEISPLLRSNKPILGYFQEGTWQDWDCSGQTDSGSKYNIREVIPAELERTPEELYTVDQVFEAAEQVWNVKWSTDSLNEVKSHLKKINDPSYKEYLRLRAIYESEE